LANGIGRAMNACAAPGSLDKRRAIEEGNNVMLRNRRRFRRAIRLWLIAEPGLRGSLP
jgi:predicted nucleic acid-binding Zn ribbon protein